MRTRRAFSLIELLWVMSFVAMVFTIACTLLTTALNFSQWSRSREQTRIGVSRLSDQLRADIAMAQSASSVSSAKMELVMVAGRVINYQSFETSLHREEREGERLISREAYLIPVGTSCEFDCDSATRRVRATVRRSLPGSNNPTIVDVPQQIECYIDVVAGTRLRLLVDGGASK